MQFTSRNLFLGLSRGCYWFAPSGEISVRSLIGICFWKKPTGFTPFKNTFYSTAKECVTSQNLGLCICFFRLCKILLPTQCPGWLRCLSHWACQWPAGLYKSWVEAVNTFFPSDSVYQWPAGLYKWKFEDQWLLFPSFLVMVFLLDSLHGFSEMHNLFLLLITQHFCRLINSCWIFSMPKKIIAVMGRV